ncbi:MAG TPA: SemiSWEET transporter [Rhizomicrobium sp.]|jgi:MtN3 and saliva related transmembrane protein
MISMQIALIVGAVAAICSTVSFAPQAWKIIRTRETKDISTGMYLLTVGGFAAWVIYGLMLMQWPLIVANSICFFLSAFILAMKLLPRAHKDAIADAVTPGKR